MAETKTEENPKVGVVVLGMGRSGTSSVTRMFASAGFFVGSDEELMPANEANPTGHWERLSVWRANERVLEKFGASWFDPPSATEQLSTKDWALPLLHSEVGRLVDESAGAPVALKDPRIGVMMSLWGPVLCTAFHPVVVVRDPFEIALSLQQRDGTPTAFGLAAWELHMTLLLSEFDSRSVTVAPYAQLIEQEGMARSIVEESTKHIEPSRVEFVRAELAGKAFRSRLHRNRASPTDHHEHLTSRQLELWRFLSSLIPGNQSIELPDTLSQPGNAVYAAVRRETHRVAECAERTRLAHELGTNREQIATLTQSLTEQQEQCAQLSAELQVERDALQTQQNKEQRGAEEHAMTEQWLASIQQSLSWRLTEPLRAFKRILKRG